MLPLAADTGLTGVYVVMVTKVNEFFFDAVPKPGARDVLRFLRTAESRW
jgi:hypothetical protein